LDQTLNELPYAVWRDYDPEDTIRFYGLRMHELGMIKSSPQKLIAEHTRQLSLCPVSDQTRAH